MRFSFRHSLLSLAALCAACAALVAPATAAAKPVDVIKDCAADEKVDGDYSPSELRQAIKLLRSQFTDLSDYSDCGALIRNQIGGGGAGARAASAGNNGIGGGGGAGDGGSGAVAGDSASGGSEARKVKGDTAASSKNRELARSQTEDNLGDRNIDPRQAGVFEQADSSNGLPLPVLLGLIALALALTGSGVLALKRRPALLGSIKQRVRLPRRRG